MHCELLIGLGSAQRQLGRAEFRDTLLEAAREARRIAATDLLVRAAERDAPRLRERDGRGGWGARRDAPRGARCTHGRRRRPAVTAAVHAGSRADFAGDWPRPLELSDRRSRRRRRLGDPKTLERGPERAVHGDLDSGDACRERYANTTRSSSSWRLPAATPREVLGASLARDRVHRARRAARGASGGSPRRRQIADRIGQPTARWLAAYDRAHAGADPRRARGSRDMGRSRRDASAAKARSPRRSLLRRAAREHPVRAGAPDRAGGADRGARLRQAGHSGILGGPRPCAGGGRGAWREHARHGDARRGRLRLLPVRLELAGRAVPVRGDLRPRRRPRGCGCAGTAAGAVDRADRLQQRHRVGIRRRATWASSTACSGVTTEPSSDLERGGRRSTSGSTRRCGSRARGWTSAGRCSTATGRGDAEPRRRPAGAARSKEASVTAARHRPSAPRHCSSQVGESGLAAMGTGLREHLDLVRVGSLRPPTWRGRLSDEGRRQKVVILGGGCGGVTAAFELTATPDLRDRFEVDAVHARLAPGGQGGERAQPPTTGWRIEEHGLHIWFGFYDNSFDLMRAGVRADARGPRTRCSTSWTTRSPVRQHPAVA